MLLPTSKTFISPDFPLSGGERLAELTVAYETWGQLNKDGSNAILVCHGYTNTPHAGGDSNGWFHNLMGPGKAVDTDKYFVVCSNMIGSAYGTSGPATINPATDAPYGPDFPKYTTTDMIEAQRRLIDYLGIAQLKAVIGYSYGGHLTFLWGALYPERMRSLVPIAGVITRKNPASQVQAVRDRFAQVCPGWNGGHYYGAEKESGVFDEMVTQRLDRLRFYGVGRYLEDTIADPEERETVLRNQAEKWASEFDANSLSLLYEAGVGSSAEPMVGNIRAPLLNVLSRTDSLIDVALGQPTVDMINSNGGNARFVEIDTEYGHAGPMVDAHKWENELREFLETTD